ncbi:hypothetical protein [Plantactinospora sp. GCM10030261]|uniref:hypothetical protein n=1 Tax=Plantactinospora sp. GCM10030261 TaxID=3273420 RepID=UPI00361DDA70
MSTDIRGEPLVPPGNAADESDAGTWPARVRWLPLVVVVWGTGYGGLRLIWAAGAAPTFPPPHSDVTATHALAGGLAVAAAAIGVVLSRIRSSTPVLVAAWLVVVGLVATAPMLLLDLVGRALPGLGLPWHAGAAVTRLGAVGGAGLLGLFLVGQRPLWRSAGCRSCRSSARGPGTPWWGWIAGYLAVAGCLVRLAAQLAVEFGRTPFAGGASVVAFEVGFLLAGVLLPLALVHTWGRRWPRWVRPLAGRRVPRWLPLGPAFVLSAGLVVYFGVGIAQLAVETARGESRGLGLPLAFFWVAMPAYWIWGFGLGVAALAYRAATLPPCRRCAGATRPTGAVGTPAHPAR